MVRPAELPGVAVRAAQRDGERVVAHPGHGAHAAAVLAARHHRAAAAAGRARRGRRGGHGWNRAWGAGQRLGCGCGRRGGGAGGAGLDHVVRSAAGLRRRSRRRGVPAHRRRAHAARAGGDVGVPRRGGVAGEDERGAAAGGRKAGVCDVPVVVARRHAGLRATAAQAGRAPAAAHARQPVANVRLRAVGVHLHVPVVGVPPVLADGAGDGEPPAAPRLQRHHRARRRLLLPLHPLRLLLRAQLGALLPRGHLLAGGGRVRGDVHGVVRARGEPPHPLRHVPLSRGLLGLSHHPPRRQARPRLRRRRRMDARHAAHGGHVLPGRRDLLAACAGAVRAGPLRRLVPLAPTLPRRRRRRRLHLVHAHAAAVRVAR
mmetsp:Transcript_10893/g.37944  ORF Transcript_10893/g.37944 Transcript_10893/m.37944 type:complete len:373 (+) Transcript_10893:554-1672(+)